MAAVKSMFHHVALRSGDVPRLTKFYRDVVGLPASARGPVGDATRTWLQAGETVVMIERADDGEPPPGPGSLDLLAFAAGSLADAEARCAAAGVTVEARTNFTLYVRDPDGRRVGLSVYDFVSRDA